MSFILRDSKLLEELIRLGQQAQAPATKTPATDPNAIKNIALKFVNNLNSHVQDKGDEFSAEKADAKLSTKYLEDLPKFLNFLQYNGIAVGNKKLVLSHAPKAGGAMQAGANGDAEYTVMDDASKALYAKYPDVDGDNFQYYIYKDGLIKYLQDLQRQSAENSPRGRMLRMYVKSLISKVNEELEIQVPAPSAQGGIAPNQALDLLPDILDVTNPNGQGTHALMQSDLASQEVFWNWMSKESLQVNIGQGAISKNDMDKDNVCGAVQVLYIRALRSYNTRHDAISKQYLQLVQSLAAQMPECKIGQQPSAGQQSPNQQVGYVTSQGAFTPQGQTAMANLELPLVRGQLVFERIKRFAESFLKIYPTSGFANSVLASLGEIAQYRVAALHLHQDTYQKLDSQIRANTSNQKSAGDYLKRVEVMLSNTQQMLMQIQEMFRRAGTGNASDAGENGIEGYKAELDDQIRNIYMENSEGLDILQNQGQAVLRDITNQVKGKQTW